MSDGRAPVRNRRGEPPVLCAIEDCSRPYVARGWCITHYQRWRRHGSALGDIRVFRTVTPRVRGAARAGMAWTAAESGYLIAHLEDMSIDDIASALERPPKGVETRINLTLGLKKRYVRSVPARVQSPRSP